MKIKTLVIISFLVLCMFLSGCNNKQTDIPTEQNPTDSVVTDEVDDTVNDDDTQKELLAPVMDWWELYNPNGFDTVTCLITNPNDVAIDVSYDLVFYKDGVEVSRIEACSNFSIMSNHKDIIWMNYDVPSVSDANDVKMENVNVTETYYPPIDGTFEHVGIIDEYDCYDFTFDSKPELATIWFVLYIDNNGNGKFDKGEIVVVSNDYLTEQTGRASFDAGLYSYTNADVYFTAY